MESIPHLIETLHSYGVLRSNLAHYLGISPAMVTLIAKGERDGEKYRQKLLTLLEVQKKKHETLVSYDTEKQQHALVQVTKQTDWEIAHQKHTDRVQMFE